MESLEAISSKPLHMIGQLQNLVQLKSEQVAKGHILWSVEYLQEHVSETFLGKQIPTWKTLTATI